VPAAVRRSRSRVPTTPATAHRRFTAYGSPRNATTWSGAATSSELTAAAGITRQGYTFQTQLGLWMGLNHMNGRVQDSITGRFLSPDPSVPDRTDPQSYNRYSYVRNNPLTRIDPSGFGDDPKTYVDTNATNGNSTAPFGGTVVVPGTTPAPPSFSTGSLAMPGETSTPGAAETGNDAQMESSLITAKPVKPIKPKAPPPPQQIPCLQGVDCLVPPSLDEVNVTAERLDYVCSSPAGAGPNPTMQYIGTATGGIPLYTYTANSGASDPAPTVADSTFTGGGAGGAAGATAGGVGGFVAGVAVGAAEGREVGAVGGAVFGAATVVDGAWSGFVVGATLGGFGGMTVGALGGLATYAALQPSCHVVSAGGH
jgi:RHS repeat-associated protein